MRIFTAVLCVFCLSFVLSSEIPYRGYNPFLLKDPEEAMDNGILLEETGITTKAKHTADVEQEEDRDWGYDMTRDEEDKARDEEEVLARARIARLHKRLKQHTAPTHTYRFKSKRRVQHTVTNKNQHQQQTPHSTIHHSTPPPVAAIPVAAAPVATASPGAGYHLDDNALTWKDPESLPRLQQIPQIPPQVFYNQQQQQAPPNYRFQQQTAQPANLPIPAFYNAPPPAPVQAPANNIPLQYPFA